MHKLMIVGLLVALFALRAVPAVAENPHDGYVFWLPCGELTIGDAASEKEFNYSKTTDGATFTVKLRRTRFDVPAGQVVVIAEKDVSLGVLSVDGKTVGKSGMVTFIPRDSTDKKNEINVAVAGTPTGKLKFYYTDDFDKLDASTKDVYQQGISAFWTGDFAKAKSLFTKGAGASTSAESSRLFRRLARWADAEITYQKIKTGDGFYSLGLYSMVGGYWDLAYNSFKRATELMPNNPDAWYMLADSASYKYSDLDLRMENIYPYYRKAADLYPRENSNTFRTFFGFFTNLLVKDGDRETILNMTPEQMDYVKKVWEWDSAIMEAASKGALRMVNTYRVVDELTDSRDPWDAKPYQGLFKAGEVETFEKMTGWGASDACGADCGPDRSAFINMGIREWDTMLHEWNHTLDWKMITSELGIGVPTTHSSDWCGFEPISSMGMGHHSCNRYYMTPGMYRYVRGTDPVTTEYITDWRVTGFTELAPAVTEKQLEDSRFADQFVNRVRSKSAKVKRPAMSAYTIRPVSEDGFVDLMATMPGAPKNGYAFARTYIYSPKQQKVRMWIGADDNMRMWLNDRLIRKGTTYWACALFTDCKEKDMTAKGVVLEKGWNEVIVQISNAQHGVDWLAGPTGDTWGFSVRICDNQNREVPGIKWQSTTPKGNLAVDSLKVDTNALKRYSWAKVADDYTVLIPELKIEHLREITGYRTMTATNEILFDLSKEVLDPAIKPHVIDKSDPNDVALNNQLNWFFSPREFAAVVRYQKDGEMRDLLFIRPEVYDIYPNLIPVSSEAKRRGIKSHADQVIGYFLTERDDSPNGRIVLVIDTYLGKKLPVDEEDLMSIGKLK